MKLYDASESVCIEPHKESVCRNLVVGNIGLFALRASRRIRVPPFEFEIILRQIEAAGWKSLPLVLSSGLALRLVLSLYIRSTLARFGA